MSQSPETSPSSREVRTRRVLIGAVAALLVVAAVLVVMLVRRPSASGGEPSADSYNTSLDNVVPREGAARQSANVPAVGVGYPDTCIGAAQAAGGWSQQVFAVADGAVGVEPAAFAALVLEEILTDDATIDEYGPVMSMAATADAVAEAAEAGQPLPEDEPEFGRGGFKLHSCTEGSEAVITVVGSVLTDGWDWDADSRTSSTPGESVRQVRFLTYHLVSVDNEWRVQQVTEPRDEVGAWTTFGDAWMASEDGVLTEDVRKALKADMGAGGHLYVERG